METHYESERAFFRRVGIAIYPGDEDTGIDRVLNSIALGDGIRSIPSIPRPVDGGRSSDVGKDIIVTNAGSIVAVGGNRSENPPFDDIILLILQESDVP